MEQQADQAEIAKLTKDGLLVHIALCNMKGDKLKDKFLISKELTIAKMRDLATAHEMALCSHHEYPRGTK